MVIGFPKENADETRVALLPEQVTRILKLPGAEVAVEKNFAAALGIPDEAYEKAGAKVLSRKEILAQDLVIRVSPPEAKDIAGLKSGAFHLSFLDPFRNPKTAESLAKTGVRAASIEMIPRSTRAQRMDVLSSQASLAGYVAVIVASEQIDRIFPMMMTPAGTIPPSKVLVIGAGVAGLQAIATARRLGAKVEAFDTRPVVKEQVQSLGAKFVEIDLGEIGQTEGGYAKALTEEQLAKQKAGLAKVIAGSEVVITTAQVFGKAAPRIVTAEMVAAMKSGAVLVDLAVETGGNVEGSVPGEITLTDNNVKIIGLRNLPGRVARHSSLMLGGNFTAFLEEFWNKEQKAFAPKAGDDIIAACLVAENGALVHPALLKK